MLMIGSNVVGSQVCKYWITIRMHVLCKPINVTCDALVDCCTSFEIGFIGVSCRNGINRVTGAVQCHVWNHIHLVYTKMMSYVLGEIQLAEVDRSVRIFLA